MIPCQELPREYELIADELREHTKDIIDVLDGIKSPAVEAVAALFHARLMRLEAGYREESARRVPSQSTEAGAWPTVDRIDLHLPSYPAPEGKVHAGLDKDGAVWWQPDGYYMYDRKTRTTTAITEEAKVAYIKREMETYITQGT